MAHQRPGEFEQLVLLAIVRSRGVWALGSGHQRDDFRLGSEV